MDIEKLALDYIASLGVTEHARAEAIKQGFIAGFIRGMNESGQPLECKESESLLTRFAYLWWKYHSYKQRRKGGHSPSFLR